MDEIRKYYSYRKIEVVGYDETGDHIYFELDIPCDKLTKENTCALHNDPQEKPYICHRYPWYKDDIEGCGFTIIP